MSSSSQAATGAVLNATVLTLDRSLPSATAVAWRGETLIAVGDEHDVRPHLDRNTEVIDGTGSVVLPGLVDAHIHPFHGTLLTRGVDLRAARTIEQVRALDAPRAGSHRARRMGARAFGGIRGVPRRRHPRG